MTPDQVFDQFLQDHGLTEQPFSTMVKLRKAFDAGRTDGRADRPSGTLLDVVREAAETRTEVAVGPEGEAVFINYGDSERQMIEAAKHACPACFGSGHVDDVPKHLRVLLEGYGQEQSGGAGVQG